MVDILRNESANTEKEKALEAAMLNIQKKFGKGAIMEMGSKEKMAIEAISTGSMKLDEAIGIGGVPKGRITEIFGPESSGKTTLTLHMIAEAQKAGGKAAFIDVENALDVSYAKNLGVNVDALIISQPDTGEDALEICEMLVSSGAIDIIVIDSVAALVPKAEINGEMGDSHVGLQARLMSQALRKLAGVINRTNTVAVFINQLREKVGVIYGSPEVTTGGRALKFYASLRLDIRKKEVIKSGDEMLGTKALVKVVKNKVAPPFKQAEIRIDFGTGINKYDELVEIAVERKIIEKAGSWFSYDGGRVRIQGQVPLMDLIKDDPALFDEIHKKIKFLETGEIIEEETTPPAVKTKGRGKTATAEEAV